MISRQIKRKCAHHQNNPHFHREAAEKTCGSHWPVMSVGISSHNRDRPGNQAQPARPSPVESAGIQKFYILPSQLIAGEFEAACLREISERWRVRENPYNLVRPQIQPYLHPMFLHTSQLHELIISLFYLLLVWAGFLSLTTLRSCLWILAKVFTRGQAPLQKLQPQLLNTKILAPFTHWLWDNANS